MVYLINAVDTNLYKVGYTNKDVNFRMKALQTGCPYKLKLIHSVNGSVHHEKKIHEFWDHLRTNGEWFEFKTEFVLEKIRSQMDSINVEQENNFELIKHKEYILEMFSSKGKDFIREKGITNLLELAILNIKLKHYDESIINIVEYLAHLNGRYSNNAHVKNVYLPTDDLFIHEDEMIYKSKIERKVK